MQKRNKKILSVCSLASLVISSSVVSTGVKAASSQPSSTRISGADRYETAVQVSKTGWTSSDYVVIANGQGYADALCADPLAKAKNAPVLLTQSDSLSSSTIAEIKRLNAKHVIIVGGTGVVKANIENAIKSQTGADITRYGGTDRYETSTKIAAAIGTTSKVVLASGQGFADALSAAPAASIEGVPIILTQANSLPQTSANYIKANSGITKTYVIGGTASVSDSVLSQVPGGQRFGGSDRFATNKAVIEGLSSDFNFNNVYVALGVGPNGNEFADALTGAALAAKNKNALVITSNPLSSYTTQLLSDKLTTSSTITVLGGTANISDSILSQLKSAVTNTGSTSGGGGGYIKTTAELIADKLNSYMLKDNLNSFKVTASGNTINVTGKYATDHVTKPEEIFANVDNAGADVVKQRVQKVSDLLNEHFALANLNGKDLKTILAEEYNKSDSQFKQYVTSDGNIDVDNVTNKIMNKTTDYATFNLNLKNAIYDSLGTSETQNAPLIAVKDGANLTGLSITQIKKDAETAPVYSTTINKKTVVDNIFGQTTTTGDYALTLSNGEVIYVNVGASK